VVTVAGDGVRLLVDGRPCPSFDHAPTRDEWYTPWGGPPSVRSVSVAPDSGWIYVNVHVGGILRSRDEGLSWEATLDLHHDVHEVLALADGVVLAACGDAGLAESFDGGSTWHLVTDGLPLDATYARAVALTADGSTVLLSASQGPGGQHAAVYRRPLRGGGPFEVVVDGISDNVDTGRLSASRFESDGGDVYLSDDGGVTWRRA
jgi:BNR/Asp-box repeat